MSFIVLVMIVLFCTGRNISLRPFLSVAHLFHKPQMPPRRDPDNDNNNDQESRTEAMMQQMMTAQTQLMTMMAQFVAIQNNQQQPPPPPPPQVDRLTRFLKLMPNKFTVATEPIVADDWLRAVHGNLVTCECTDAEMVKFAAHLLEGPAARWWETFQITHPLATMTWETFEEGFRTAHISAGAMNLKQEEFRNLKQGNRSLTEYMDAQFQWFSNLFSIKNSSNN